MKRLATIRTAFARVGFPLAVLTLALLAIPVLILVIMNLLGQGGAVNQWLLENYQFTFAPPIGLVLALLAIIPAIILLYFLKLKRQPLQVPSTFLWRKSIEDLHVNSLFQWLRKNLLLFLQILAVLGLLFALMGFRFHGNTTRGKHYILIIDTSASMAATDVLPSRLHWVKEQALKEIDAASDDDFGMVIVFNSKATTLQGYTNNRAKLREAVSGIQQSQRPTRIQDALALADSLANPVRSGADAAARPEKEDPGQARAYVPPQGLAADVHLYSDGGFPAPTASELANLSARLAGNTKALGNLNLRFHMAGLHKDGYADNLGIVTFNAVRWVGELEPDDPARQKLQVLIGLRNYRTSPVTRADGVRLKLDVKVDGRIVHPEQSTVVLSAATLRRDDDVTVIEPGEQTISFILPALDLRSTTVLHAHLENHQDIFAADDQAWLVLNNERKARVLIVGPTNVFLRAFFDQDATRKLAVVQYLEPNELDKEAYRKLAHGGELDMVIFDRCGPADVKDLPHANTFFIDRPPPPWQRTTRTLKRIHLEPSKREHPLLRHLTTLHEVGANEGFEFVEADLQGPKAAPPMTRIVETSRKIPVLFSLPRGPYTDVVMTFPLLNAKGDLLTDFVVHPTFPMFMRNLVFFLGNLREAVRANSVQAGEAIVLRPEGRPDWLQVVPPRGSPRKLQPGPRGEFTFADTETLGLHDVVRPDGSTTAFAVNLLDSNESSVSPRKEIRIGADKYIAGQERDQPLELWKWILVVVFLLLLVEWYVYNRRIYV